MRYHPLCRPTRAEASYVWKSMPIGSLRFQKSSASAISTPARASGTQRRRAAVTVRPYSNIGGRHVDTCGDTPHAKSAGDGRDRRGADPPGARALVLPSAPRRSEEHTSELQSHLNLVCRLLLEKKKIYNMQRESRLEN